jgi:glutaredoxin
VIFTYTSCDEAKSILDTKGIQYKEIDLKSDKLNPDIQFMEKALFEIANRKTFPIIYINKKILEGGL